MKPILLRRLLVGLALFAACGTIEGNFTVDFLWKHGKPAFPNAVYVFSRVVERDPNKPDVELQLVGPVKYQGSPINLPFNNVPNGNNRVVVVEMHETSSSASQTEYYGESASFSIEPGQNKVVPVTLDITAAPGFGGDGGTGGGSVAVVCPTTTGYVNTEKVDLVLVTDTGVSVKLANDLSDLDGAPLQSLKNLPAPAGSTTGVVFSGWDLGATSTASTCDVTKAVTGCPRKVYAEFLDAHGYVSPVVTTDVVLDEVAPTLAPPPSPGQTASPSDAKVGDTIQLAIVPDESLSSLSVASVSPLDGQSPITLSTEPDNTFTYTVTSASPTGHFDATFTLVDLAGNSGTSTPPLAFQIDTLVPTISNVTTDRSTYSEVAGYTVVTLTFDCPKSVGTAPGDGTTAGLIATLSGREMSCTYQAQTPNYTCVYTIATTTTGGITTPTVDTTGAQPIVLATLDEAGNSDSYSTSVTFDFTPLVLGSTVAPSPAKASDTPVMAVTSDKPLMPGPTLVVSPTGSLGTWTSAGAGTSWTFGFGQVPPIEGTFTLTATATDVAGHVGMTSSTLIVNTIVPVITKISTDKPVYSEEPGFNLVTLNFDTAKAVDSPGDHLSATVGGSPMTCGTYQAQSPRYTCTYAVLGTEGTGTEAILINAADSAGNASSASTSVTFDFAPLTLGATIAPNPAKANDIPTLSLAAGKAITNAPTLVITEGGNPSTALGTPVVGGAGTSWTYAFPAAVAPLAGTFVITAMAVDNVGHPATATPATPFVVDAVIPTIENLATDAQTYSEVMGFNFVTVTFDTPKSLDPGTGATLTATIGGLPLTCGTYQTTSPGYTCTYQITGMEVPGTQLVAIAATDEVGNQGAASTTVTFDFTPLNLSETVSPNPALAGGTPVLSVSSNKSLALAPTITVTPAGTPTGSLGTAVVGGSATSWTFTYSAFTPPVIGTFGLVAAAQDDVGHTATTPSTALVIDSLAPTITNVAANATTYSEITGFNQLVLTFNTTKSLDTSGSTLTVTAGSTPLSCGMYQPATSSYSCTLTVTAGLGAGTKIISVQATDEAGNQGSGSTTVTFDFTPLTLSETSTPNPTLAGGTPVLSVNANKSLALAPVITVTPSGTPTGDLGTPVIGGAGTAWTFTYSAFTPPTIGNFGLVASSQDSVGHTATTTSTTLVIDSLAPTITNVATNATLFSEVVGFNQLVVTFNTTKSLDTPGSALTVTAGDAPLTCDTYEVVTSSYTCALTVTPVLGAGTKIITVQAADEAGNQSSASTTVAFDFTALVLGETVAPNPTQAGGTPVLSVSSNKSLTTAPVITITPSGTPTGALGTPAIGGSGTSWTFTYNAPTTPLIGTFGFVASSQDTVGHTASTTSTTLIVDSLAPTITNVATNATLFSDIAGFNQLQLTFNTTKSLDTTGSTLTATVGSTPLSCGTYMQATSSYLCTLTVTAALGNGSKIISIQATDEAGNASSASTTVTFDFTALILGETVAPNPTQAGGTAVLSVSSNKPLTVAPVITVTPSGTPTGELGTPVIGGGGTSWTFTYSAASAPVIGSFGLVASSQDSVGHTAATASTTLVIDTLAPTITNVATNATLFSDVTGFNQLQLTFNTTKSLDTPGSTLTATVGSTPISCGSYIQATSSYLCTLAVTAVLGNGTQIISIQAADEAGNASSASTTVTFDFTALILGETIAPNPTQAGGTAVLSVSSNKPLTTAPVITVTPSGTPTGALGTPVIGGGGTSWTFTYSAATTPVIGTFGFVASSQDSVGHTAATTSTTLIIDTLAPTITNVATNASLFSDVAGFNQLQLTFNTTKSLDTTGSTLTATVGGTPLSCGTYQSSAPSYTCTLAVTAALGNGSQIISIQASDEAGNQSSASTTVTFDFTPLILGETVAPNPTQAGGTAVLSVSSNKPLTVAPLITVTPVGTPTGALGTPVTGGSGTSWTFTYSAATNPLIGSFGLVASSQDSVGHTAATAVTTLVIDNLAPTITNVATNATLFSEVTGFNQLQVTFNTTKSLDTAGSTLTVTAGATPLTCGTYQAATSSYLCTLAVTPSLGAGTKIISIQAADEAGNQSSASTTVAFDFTPLLLGETIAPNPTQAGGTPVLSVSSNKSLTAAPIITVTPAGTPTGALGMPTIGGGGTNWTFTYSAPTTPLIGSFGFVASSQDTVGHTGVTTSTTLIIDSLAPTITNVATNATLFSDVTGFNQLQLTFNTTKSLDTPGSTLTATVGSTPLSCGTYSQATSSYLCTLTVTAILGNGSKIISIQAADEAGNQSSASTTVTFDFTPLTLTETVTPNPTQAGGTPVLSVAANKSLASPPVITVTPVGTPTGALGPPTVGGSGTSWTFTYGSSTNPLIGNFGIVASSQDTVGHTAATTSTTLVVDNLAPTITNVATNATLFSEVTGFNQLQVTFNTTKSLDTSGSTLTVTAGSTPVPCGLYQAATSSYLCTLTVTTSLGAGTKIISIQATDEAGNQSSASTTVTFDFTPLMLGETIAPNPTQAGGIPVLSVSSNKPLTVAPALTVTPVGTPTGALGTSAIGGGGTNWTFTYNAFVAPLIGTFGFVAASQDTVGHTASTGTTTLIVDSLAPTITNVATNATLFSDVAGFNQLQLTFNTTKSLDTPGSTLTATVGTTPLSCGTYIKASSSYLCTLTVTAAVGSGSQIISIQTADEAGNQSSASTTVTFDFTPLVLTETVTPNPTQAGGTPVLSVAANKPLAQPPVITVTPVGSPTGDLGAPTVGGGGTAWTFTYGSTTNPLIGSFGLVAASQDSVGHTAVTSTTTLLVDNLAPTIMNVATNGTLFSEVTGFNQLQVTFDTTKSLDTPGSTLTVMAGSTPLSCGTYQVATSSYLCTLTVTPTLGAGTKIISIQTADEAGNMASASTTVAFDFTPLILGETISPNPTQAGGIPVLSVSSNKSLTGAPLLTITPIGTPTGALGMPVIGGSGTSWTFTYSAPATPLIGSFTFVASSQDTVGHTGATGSTTLIVDSLNPTITNVATNGTLFSDVAGFNQLQLTFNTTKSLNTAGSTLTATVGSTPLSCGTYQTTAPNYTCTLTVTAAVGGGSQIISIQAVDEAGNQSSASTTVTFDFTPLTLSETVTPNPTQAGGTPVLSVAANKSLVSAPLITVTPVGTPTGSLGTPTIGGSGTAWTFTYGSATIPLIGSFGLVASSSDSVGHTASTASTTLLVDNLAPTISNVATNGTLFSEVTGFNELQVTFDTPKTLDTPGSTLTVTAGGTPLTCGTWQFATGSYTCTLAITTSLTAGTKIISILAQDEAGNTSSASTTVTFDFTPLILGETVAPNPTQAGGTPVLSVSSNKSLTVAPSLTVTPVGTPTGALGTPLIGGGGTSWTFTYNAPTTPLIGKFGFVASSSDNVGHTNTTASTTLIVDSLNPTITNVATNATLFSDVTGFNLLSLTFNTTKSLNTTGSTLTATVGGTPLTCGSYQTTAPSYTCTLTVSAGLGNGTKIISIQATDEAGNASSASTTVTFDFTALTLTETVTPNPTQAGGTPVLSVAANKSLTSQPVIAITPVGTPTGSLGAPTVGGSGTSWTFTYGSATNPVIGSFGIVASSNDSVGHTATTTSTTLVIDNLAPTITNVATNGTIFSEVTGFNSLLVTFDVPKSLNTAGSTLSVTAGSTPLNCGTWQFATSSYTCTLAVTTSLGAGTKIISIVAQDEAGNESSASTTVTFDFTPLILGETIAPNPTQAGGTPVLSVSSNKSLTAAPTITVTPSGTPTGALGTPLIGGSGTSWTFTYNAPTTPLIGKFGFVASSSDGVGHSNTTASTTLVVDSLTPTISNVATNATLFSDVAGFNMLSLTFNTTKSLNTTGSTLTATVGGTPLSCGTYQPTAPSYTCTLTVTAALGNGTKIISIQATDEAGNASSASTTVTFDFTALTLAETVTPNPTQAGGTPVLSVAANKSLTSQPVITITPVGTPTGSLGTPTVGGSGTSWTFTYSAATSPVIGSFGLVASSHDSVGHTATTTSTTLVIDSLAPTITNVATNGTIFSEVTGFNSLQVTFDVPKSLNTAGSTLMVTAGGTPLSCGTWQFATSSYTCTLAVTTSLGAGTKLISIVTQDEAGNESSASTTVTFDFTPLILGETIAPNPTQAGGTPVLSVSSNKSLTAAPTITVTPSGTPTGALGTPLIGGSGTSWTFTYNGPTTPLIGKFGFVASSSDGVGHSNTTASTTLVVDSLTPTISNVATNATLFSDVAGFNMLGLTFNTTKSLNTTGSTLTATVGGTPLICGAYQPTAPSYTCTLTVTSALGNGTKIISIQATDEAGNASSASTTVTFDFTALTLTETVTPNPTQAGGTPVLSIAANKSLTSQPLITITPVGTPTGSLGTPTVGGSGTSWTFTYGSATNPVIGSFGLVASSHDSVGHTATTTSTTLVIDSLAPTITNVATNGTIFSEVTGFNSLQLTFNTTKSLNTAGSTLTATAGSTPLTCGTYQATAPNYTCTLTVTTSLVAGTKIISIQAADEAGNQSSASTTVTFDFTPLVLGETIAPNPTQAGGTPVLSVSSNKSLASAPTITVTPVGTPTGALGTPAIGGSGTSWTFTYNAPTTPLIGKFGFVASSADNVGHTNTTASTTLIVDSLTPTISNVATNASLFSEVAGFNMLSLTFNTTKSLNTTGSTLTATAGGTPLTCGTYQTTAPSYTCTLTVTSALGSGSKIISIQATDEAGNASSASTTVTFDFTALTLTETVNPNPTQAGGTPVLSVASNKSLTAAPTIAVTPVGTPTGTLGAATVGGSATLWTYTYASTSNPLIGSFGLVASAHDSVGHNASTTSTTLVVDNLAPTISTVATNATLFSEVTGFNLLSLTFNTTKSLNTAGSTLTATAGGTALSCGAYQTTSPSYTCTLTVTTALGAGTKIISIVATDEAGNQSTASTTVTFDFTPLTLGETISPNPTQAGGVAVLSVSSNKSLAAAPTITITPSGTPTGSLGTAVVGGAGTSWTFTYSAATSPVIGSYGFVAASHDSVGHTNTTASTTLVIDTLAPTISNVATNASLFSEVTGFNMLSLTFNTTKSLNTTGSTLTATVGGTPLSCGTYQTASPSYTCTLTVTSALGSGSKIISIQANDEAGNQSSASATVTFDFTPLALQETITPNPTQAGGIPVLSVTSNKSLTAAPTIAVTPVGTPTGALGTPVQGGSGTAWTFTYSASTNPLIGSFGFVAASQDTVGHTAMTTSTNLVVDNLAPSITNVATNATLFSEVAGFNNLQITFDTPKSLNTAGSTLAVTVGGAAATCGTWQFVTMSYTCTLTVTTALGAGTKIISIQTEDEAGNMASASTTVTFDFTALVLGETIAPNPTLAGGTPVLSVSSNKTLASAPTITVTPVSTPTGSLGTPTQGGSGTSWTFTYGAASVPLIGSFGFVASSHDNVGHTNTTGTTTLSIDNLAPTISNVSTNATLFSEIVGFNNLSVTFDTTKSLDTTGSTLSVTVGGAPLTCGTYQMATSSYTCTLTVTSALGAGTKILSIQTKDEAGNQGSASTTVTFDFTPLILGETIAPNPTQAGGTAVLSVSSNKTLAAAPTITVTPSGSPVGSLGTAVIGGSGTSWTFTYSAASNPIIGSYRFVASSHDSVGHTDSTSSTTLVIDTLAPAITNVATNASVYSEVTGFNSLQVTFDTPKSLNTAGSTLTVTVGGAPLSCGSYLLATGSYLCTLTVTSGLGAGTKTISIQAQDEAGNQSSASTSVTFDFTALTLGETVVPNPSNATGTPVLTVSSNKSLLSAPSVAVTPVGTVTGSLGTPVTAGSATSFTYTYSSPVTPLSGKFSLLASATDSVGHVATVAPVTLVVDDVVPTVSSVATNATTYSEVSGFNALSLTFNTNKSLNTAGSSVSAVIVGGSALTCGTYQPSPGPSYTCTLTVLSAMGSGTKTITITATDETGNAATANTSVTFDFVPLTLNATVTPNPVAVGAHPVLSVNSNKTLAGNPTVNVTGSPSTALGTPVVAGSGTSWTYTYSAISANVRGSFTLAASATDSVGHAATPTSSALVVDNIGPSLTAPVANRSTYSEVSAFNVVTVTFNSGESLDGTGQLSVTITGGFTMGCGTYKPSTPNYTCTYNISATGTEGSGPKIVSVTGTDEGGNTQTVTTSITFDFAKPTLSSVVAPSPALLGSAPVLSVTASKSLSTCTVGATALGTPVQTGSGTSFTFSYPAVPASLADSTISLTSTGTDAVGHSAMTTSTLVADGVVPTISAPVITGGYMGQRFSSVTGYKVVTLAFNTNKIVDSAGSTLTATIGGYSATPCSHTGSGPYAYTCTYTVLGTEKSGGTAITSLTQASMAIAIQAVDEVGNIGTAPGTAVVFDFAAPLLASNPVLTYTPSNVLSQIGVTPTAATVGTQVQASFSVTEFLGVSPVLTYGPTITTSGGANVLSFTQTSPLSSGTTTATSFVFNSGSMLTPSSAVDMTPTLYAQVTDLVGNSVMYATIPSPTLRVDTKVPSAPVTAAPTTRGGTPLITYARIPWGDNTTDGLASYSVAGLAGSAETGQTTDTIVVYDSNQSSGDILGHGSVSSSDGSFSSIALTRTDHPVVWLATADEAGNVSPIVATHNVSWTATFDGKTKGDTVSNPHVLLADSDDLFTLTSGQSLEAGAQLQGLLDPSSLAAPEVSSYSDLFPGSGTPLTTPFETDWFNDAPSTSAPVARTEPSMVYDSTRGVSVMFGGGNASADFSDTWEWNGYGWTQDSPTTSPNARRRLAMAYDPIRDVTVLFGGCSVTGGTCPFGDTWEWNGTNWTQIFPANSPAARQNHSMVFDAARGVIVLFGGLDAASFNGSNIEADTWEWNGTNWTNVTPGASPPGREFAGMAYDSARGVTVLFGGIGTAGSNLNDTWEWNGSTWTERTAEGAAGSPAVRTGVLAYDSERAETVLFSGDGSADTWEWNGSAWAQRTPTTSPGIRSTQAMVYDSAHGVTLCFGGNTGGTYYADLWTWNGTLWNEGGPATMPTVRSGQAQAYDSVRGVTVMFGGGGTNETWEWNGINWTQRTLNGAAGSPSARIGMGMVYDPVAQLTLLFGGQNTSEVDLGDLWKWNGTTWTQLFPSGSTPPARFGHAMAYEVSGQSVVFGGTGTSGNLNDTWEYLSGSNTWVGWTPANPPAARQYPVMVYDTARLHGVLFGGAENSETDYNDTWTWSPYTAAWTQVFANGTVGQPPTRSGQMMAYDSRRGTTEMFGGCYGALCQTGLNDSWVWNGSSWTQQTFSASPSARANGSMSYDSGRGVSVLFGGDSCTVVTCTNTNDTWLLPSDTAGVPSNIAQFDFASTGETFSTVAISGLSIASSIAGTGYTSPAPTTVGTAVNGAALAAWDTSLGGSWRVLATNAVSSVAALNYTAASPWVAETSEDAYSQTINLAVLPVEQTGTGASPGQVNVEQLELTVQYQHSETACLLTGAPPTCTQCAADEAICGTAPNQICSNLASDPQNCGACSVAGSHACAPGDWCINGSCQCPGIEVTCNGVCTDEKNDPKNCGGCNTICPASTPLCVAGACSP